MIQTPFHLKSALAAVLLAAACVPALAQNVAIVNGKAVPKTRLEAFSKQMARAGRPIAPEQLRDQVINLEVLAQEAQRRGIDATPEYAQTLEFTRQQLLANLLLRDFEQKNKVTDEEVQAEYDRFVAMAGGKEYRARHILVDGEDQAKALIAQIKAGGSFEELAKKNSKDAGSGANGGDLDWANARSYVPTFSAALVKLDKGQMTPEPVKSEFGWHIIRVDDVRETELPKLPTIKPQIEQKLRADHIGKFIEGLVKKARVE